MTDLLKFLFAGPLSLVQIIAVVVLCGWLIWEALYDVKDQNIPLFYSIVPFVAGMIYWIATGQWQYAVLILVLVGLTNIPNVWISVLSAAGFTVAAFFILPASFYPALVAFIFAFILYTLNMMGGADGLAIIYTAFWFPFWGTVVCLLVGTCLYALVRLIIRDKGDTALKLYLRIKNRDVGDHAPGLIGYAIGILLFAGFKFWLAKLS
jgi:hypothetical protein